LSEIALRATEGRPQIKSRTTFRISGITTCSNHGCFRIQIGLRQLGCGSGKNRGPYSENAFTVFVKEPFRPAFK